MSWTQVTTTRRYTQREKKAYHARLNRRPVWINGQRIMVDRWEFMLATFNYADRLGSRVPTMRVNPDVL
jgi:hypothetical protein